MSAVRNTVSVRATHGAQQSLYMEWSVNEWPEWEATDIFQPSVDADMLASLQSFRRDFESRMHKEIPAEQVAKLRRTLAVVEQRWQNLVAPPMAQMTPQTSFGFASCHKMQIASILN